MPRNPTTGIWTQPDVDVIAGTPIESDVYNTFVHDVATEFNSIRPIIAGGTGGDDIAEVLFNIGGETSSQVVTNYDTHVFIPGSFRSAAGATAAPNGHAFAGICYVNEAVANPPTNQNVIVEARDEQDTQSPGKLYVREKKAGVWGAWVAPSDVIKGYVNAFATGTAPEPLDALAFNGMQINGACEVSQANGTTPIVLSSGFTPTQLLDGWKTNWNMIPGAPLRLTVAQILANDGPPGFPAYMRTTVTTPQPSASGDFFQLNNVIEGYRIAKLAWGTPSAQRVSVGFWARFSVAGTYSIGIQGSGGGTVYATYFYTITTPNVWQWVTVTFNGITTGTWNTTNGTGFAVQIWLMDVFGNALGTTGNTCDITGLIVLPGADLPTLGRSALIQRPYGPELQMCKRYYQKYTSMIVPVAANSTTLVYPVSMRIAPAVTGGGAGFTAASVTTESALLSQTTRAAQDIVLDARL